MEATVVHVEVHGQRYPIKTALQPAYVQELAAYVHRKMELAAEASPASDILALAVLSALNIADELFRARDLHLDTTGSLSQRAERLEQIVDEALALVGGGEQSAS
jgi:cell division protein ZapA